MHEERSCSMQREWAVYLLQRSCLPPGLSRGACPHHYLSSAPVPTLQLNIPVKLHLAKKDSIKRKREKNRESLSSHSPWPCSFLPPSGAENGGNHAAPLPRRRGKQADS